ncbi:MAG: hypothetical protein JXB50_07110 [Spirochaetes bacterium]|nr:hypothetical protein [Spirochaetota bacterium]
MRKIKFLLLFIYIINSISTLYSVIFKEVKGADFNMYFQTNTSEEKINEISKKIRFVYEQVSSDLSYPLVNPSFYIYVDNDTLFDDISKKYNYNIILKKYRSKPRMSRDYKVWITVDEDIKSIAYIYCLRIIEQMCKDNYATVPLWFDLGFGEYEALNVLSKTDIVKSKKIKDNLKNQVSISFKNNKYIPLSYLCAIDQWYEYGIGTKGGLNYKISTMVVFYLIEKYGMDKIKNLLANINYGLDFYNAFQKVYEFDTFKLEDDFKSYISKFNLLSYDNFFVLYPKIYHLVGNELYKEFYTKLNLVENGIYAKSFNGFIESFENSEEYYGMKNYLAVFSYVKTNEKKAKLYEIIYKFINLFLEDIDNNISKQSSFVFLQNRDNNDPVILLGAENDENMIKVYEYLKDKKNIEQGFTIIKH